MSEIISVGKYTYGVTENKVVWKTPAWTRENKKIQPKLIVGNYCSIGHGCVFYLGGNHRYDWVTTYPFHVNFLHDGICNKLNSEIEGYPSTNGDIVIGSDVWLGENVTVMSGVKIHHGSVIGTNSVVTKDVAPYSIVGGNPAKHIKYRFDEQTILKLLEISWWDLDEIKINELLPFMVSDNLDKFFEEYYKIIKND